MICANTQQTLPLMSVDHKLNPPLLVDISKRESVRGYHNVTGGLYGLRHRICALIHEIFPRPMSAPLCSNCSCESAAPSRLITLRDVQPCTVSPLLQKVQHLHAPLVNIRHFFLPLEWVWQEVTNASVRKSMIAMRSFHRFFWKLPHMGHLAVPIRSSCFCRIWWAVSMSPVNIVSRHQSPRSWVCITPTVHGQWGGYEASSSER